MRKNKLTRDEKAVVLTAVRCVMVYVTTVAIIHVLNKPKPE